MRYTRSWHLSDSSAPVLTTIFCRARVLKIWKPVKQVMVDASVPMQWFLQI